MNAKRLIEIIIKASDQSGPAVTTVQGKLKQMLTSTAALATAAAAVGTAFVAMSRKIVAAYRDAINVAGAFERSVLEVNTLLNQDAREVRNLSERLQELAVQYGQVDEVMARAQYNVVSAGFKDVSDSMYILEVASKAAIGGLTDVNTAASVITQTLNAYGREAGDAEEVAGTLFATVKGGVTTFEQLAATLGSVTASAAAAGISFEETSAAVAVLTQKGVMSAEATTALNALILALGASSGETREKLDELGINLNRGLGPALEKISSASGDTLDGIAQLVPNIRAIRGAAVLATEGGAGFAEQMKLMTEGVKDFNAAYEIMSKSYEQAVARNEAAHKRLKDAVGSTGLEASAAALNGMADGANAQARAVERSSDLWRAQATSVGEVIGKTQELNGNFEAMVYTGWQALMAYKQFGLMAIPMLLKVKDAAKEAAVATADLLPMIGGADPSGLGPFVPDQKAAEDAARTTARAALEAAADEWGVATTEAVFDPEKMIWIDVPKTAKQIAEGMAEAYAAAQQIVIKDAPVITRSHEAAGEAIEEEMLLYEDLMALEQERADKLTGYYGDGDGERLANINGYMSPEQIAALDAEFKRHLDNLEGMKRKHDDVGDAIKSVGDNVERLGSDSISAMLGAGNGAIMFGRTLRNEVISALSGVIMKLLVIKALKSVFSFIPFGDGGSPTRAHGGGFPGAANGYSVPDGPRGMDSMIVRMMPGEEVLDRTLSMGLRRFIRSWETQNYFSPHSIQAGGGRSTIEVHMDVARPVGVLDALSYGEAAVAAAKKVQEANL